MKSKEQKRAEAVARDYVYADLDRWEKELLIAGRPGDSARERARLGLLSASDSRIIDLISDHS